MNLKRAFIVALVLLALTLVSYQPASAQTTVSTGSIVGNVSDPSGAAVPGAKITITKKDSGQVRILETTTTGTYNSGALAPGVYSIRIEAKGFKTVELTFTVQVGVSASFNSQLQVGSMTTVVKVTEEAIRVNTEQATVQDVLTAQQIEQLPVNGRNFLDLAILEPGVQIQDGSTFDPTKNGFSSVSFGGRFGRTARIELDGLDISDETVGTTTQNIPQSAIQEFQVSQSSLDLSTELTSSGSINVVSRSGSNAFHGQGFFYGRSNQLSARIAQNSLDFARKQFGGNFGGPFIKDKLFFFGDVEATKQQLQNPVSLTDPFGALSGSFSAPFTESEYVGKLDWNVKRGWTAFVRYSYNQNKSIRGFNPGVYQPFANVDHTPDYAGGINFSTGNFTHSIRVGYLKFRNAIADASAGVFNPAPGISTVIAPFLDFTCLGGGEAFCSGANILAPQATFQTNKQFKYDGVYVFRSHSLRYGIGYNKILGGGFAKFFGISPIVGSILSGPPSDPNSSEFFADNSCGTNISCFPGGHNNPLNYPVDNVLMGNGQGFFTEIPQFGFPAGGQFDSRLQWYIGDTWKARSNLTISYGVRYVRDTGRADSDLPPIPVLNQFGPGLGNRVHLPNKNFAPQLGLAWDPTGSGKTVIRVGAGIFYENAVFNNVLFDRPGRLEKGLFFGTGLACIFGGAVPVPLPSGGSLNPTFCGQPIGNVAGQIAAFQTQFQQAVIAAGPQANGSFIGNTLAEGVDSTGDQLIAPSYRTPYSFQLNAGVQRQFGQATVLTVDYVRNVGLHYLIGIDVNHIGAARFLDKTAATNAINATLMACGAATIDQAIASCQPLHPTGSPGATIADFAGSGLDSGVALTGGFPCGGGCAFPGANTNLGENQMLFPIGRSVYNALQASLKTNLNHPFRGMRRLNLIASYSLSRYNALARDSDFINNATDFDKPLHFIGPNGLDRTHIVGAGAVMDLPIGTRLSLASHWGTAGAVTLTLPTSGAPGEIFRTDVTGDGTTGDVLPGTNIGSFGRSVKVSNLNNVITNWDNTGAGQLTPAGQALVAAGLFTQAQLVALGGVTPTLALAPKGEVGASPQFTFDAHISWLMKPSRLWPSVPESITIEPSIALYNVFNFQNFDPAGNTISGVLSNTPGTVNGTTRGQRTNLITPGSSSGVNWYAVPRQAEFGIKVTF